MLYLCAASHSLSATCAYKDVEVVKMLMVEIWMTCAIRNQQAQTLKLLSYLIYMLALPLVSHSCTTIAQPHHSSNTQQERDGRGDRNYFTRQM